MPLNWIQGLASAVVSADKIRELAGARLVTIQSRITPIKARTALAESLTSMDEAVIALCQAVHVYLEACRRSGRQFSVTDTLLELAEEAQRRAEKVVPTVINGKPKVAGDDGEEQRLLLSGEILLVSSYVSHMRAEMMQGQRERRNDPPPSLRRANDN